MSHTINRTPPSLPPLLTELSRPTERAPGPLAAVAGGALAAGLGFGALVALAIALWITSPYAEGGISGPLHVAASLWLLAHGAELTRTDTLSGVPAPVGITPLLLAALPLWLAYRAAYEAARPQTEGRGAADTASTVGGAGRRASGAAVGGTRGAAGGRPGAQAGGVAVRARVLWPSARVAWGGVVTGYLLIACALTAYAQDSGLRPGWVDAGMRLPLLVGAATAVGVWRARARLRARQAPARARRARGPAGGGVRAAAAVGTDRRVVGEDRAALGADGWVVGPGNALGAFAEPSDGALARRRARAAARAAAAGVCVLLAGGALVGAAPLFWHAPAAHALFLRLADDGPGRFAVLLLALALLPNLAVWGASFALGPGVLLGASHVVAPLGTAPVPLLPGTPSLPLLPADGYGAPFTWVAGVVPLVAGITVGWCTAREAAPAFGERAQVWSGARTALVAMGAAALCGLAAAALAALAAGPMGVASLSRLGPVWWQTGPATAAWTLLLAVPTATTLRTWHTRGAIR